MSMRSQARGQAASAAPGHGLPLAVLNRFLSLVTLLRPAQAVKNVFVAAPLAFTPSAVSWDSVLMVLAGTLCFAALAGAVYVLNDFVDREADRTHPVKRYRPLAAGTVSTRAAFATLTLLVLVSVPGALALSSGFAGVLVLYACVNIAYSLRLKHIAIVDVATIAFGFILRVQAGAILIGVEPSAWIVIMTGLLALFLALAKRRDDLVRTLGADHRRSLDGYTKPFLDVALAVVLGALLVGYLIYTTDVAVMQRLGTERLYYTAPFVVLGIMRYLQLTFVLEASGSPTRVLLTDRFLIGTVVGWGATFVALLYL